MAASGNSPLQINDFQVHNFFIEDPTFDELIDLLGIENEGPVSSFNGDDLVNNASMVGNQFPLTPDQLLDYRATIPIPDPNFNFDRFGILYEESSEDKEHLLFEQEAEIKNSTSMKKKRQKKKVDPSRTLVSDRRRRGSMKEKLYALRALVPNITKMDRASIVGDAVQYMEELKSLEKKLRVEIASLESKASLAATAAAQRCPVRAEMQQKNQIGLYTLPICRRIMQIDVLQVEEREFYVKLACNKGRRVAISLYKALESLTSFSIQSSNLATASERYVLNFLINVKENHEPTTNPTILKLWVARALLNQGFELVQPFAVYSIPELMDL